MRMNMARCRLSTVEPAIALTPWCWTYKSFTEHFSPYPQFSYFNYLDVRGGVHKICWWVVHACSEGGGGAAHSSVAYGRILSFLPLGCWHFIGHLGLALILLFAFVGSKRAGYKTWHFFSSKLEKNNLPWIFRNSQSHSAGPWRTWFLIASSEFADFFDM